MIISGINSIVNGERHASPLRRKQRRDQPMLGIDLDDGGRLRRFG
jgi:hypothetical protein